MFMLTKAMPYNGLELYGAS